MKTTFNIPIKQKGQHAIDAGVKGISVESISPLKDGAGLGIMLEVRGGINLYVEVLAQDILDAAKFCVETHKIRKGR